MPTASFWCGLWNVCWSVTTFHLFHFHLFHFYSGYHLIRPIVCSSSPLHRVSFDVVGDRLAYGVADVNSARVVHPAPDPPVVTVRARLRNAGVRATRLPGGRQRKRLCVIEVAEK